MRKQKTITQKSIKKFFIKILSMSLKWLRWSHEMSLFFSPFGNTHIRTKWWFYWLGCLSLPALKNGGPVKFSAMSLVPVKKRKNRLKNGPLLCLMINLILCLTNDLCESLNHCNNWIFRAIGTPCSGVRLIHGARRSLRAEGSNADFRFFNVFSPIS